MHNLLKAILLITLFLGLSACPGKTASGVRKIDPMETKGQISNGFAVLVDVRESDEVKQGIASDASWMPTSKIMANDPKWIEFKNKLPKDKLIVLYCAVGGRAGTVAEMLSKEGFRTANMGGYDGWTAAKLPTKIPTDSELNP